MIPEIINTATNRGPARSEPEEKKPVKKEEEKVKPVLSESDNKRLGWKRQDIKKIVERVLPITVFKEI